MIDHLWEKRSNVQIKFLIYCSEEEDPKENDGLHFGEVSKFWNKSLNTIDLGGYKKEIQNELSRLLSHQAEYS